MQKVSVASLAALTITLVTAGVVSAATPLPPPLAGFVPPSKGALSCTRYVNKRITIFTLNCTLECSEKFAAAVSRNIPFDIDYCENTWAFSCVNAYQRALAKLDQGICLNCLDETARQNLFPLYRDAVATAKDQIFCDNSVANTPFPDGHGFVAANRDQVKCQNKILKSLIKASKCLNLHCHQKTAEGMYHNKPHIDNPACEDQDVIKSCKAHFVQSTSGLVGCPACVDLDAVWNSYHTALDTNNGDIYCTDDP